MLNYNPYVKADKARGLALMQRMISSALAEFKDLSDLYPGADKHELVEDAVDYALSIGCLKNDMDAVSIIRAYPKLGYGINTLDQVKLRVRLFITHQVMKAKEKGE